MNIDPNLFEAIYQTIQTALTCAEIVSIMVALISIVWFIKYLVKSAIQISRWWHKKEEEQDLGEAE